MRTTSRMMTTCSVLITRKSSFDGESPQIYSNHTSRKYFILHIMNLSVFMCHNIYISLFNKWKMCMV